MSIRPDSRKRNTAHRRTSGRVLLTIVICLSVLTVGGIAFGLLAGLRQPPEKRERVKRIYNVDVFPISRTDLPTTIAAHGTAAAEKDVTISAEVSGRILSLDPEGNPRSDNAKPEKLLKVGQRVAAGELLLQIDPTTYRQRYEKAVLQVQADIKDYELTRKQQKNNRQLVQQAKQDLKDYTEEYERVKNAVKTGAAVPSQLTKARLEWQRYKNALTVAENKQSLFPLQLAQIENRRKQHEKDRDIAQTNLEDTTIRAKFDGVLREVHVQPGQFVRLGDPLVTITNPSIVEIPAAISLDDYHRLKPLIDRAKSLQEKPRALISENAGRLYEWTGRVVRAAPQADQLTRTVKVFIRVDNRQQHRTPAKVIPGMHYSLSIQGQGLQDVFVVPRDAFTDGSVFVAEKLTKKSVTVEGKERTIWEGVAAVRKVTVQRTLQTLAVVTGLKEGDHVILTNLDVLHEGATVRFGGEQLRRLDDELPDDGAGP